MAEIFGSQDEEKSLYLTQIRYLEEQLESCQLKHDELEKKNKDLSSQCSALEKDKKDAIECQKRRLAGTEKILEETNEKLLGLQQAAKQRSEALRLQHSQQRKELQDQIDKLTSEIRMKAAKREEQLERQEKIKQLRQDLSSAESQKKQLLSMREDEEAAFHNKKIAAAELEKERRTEVTLATQEMVKIKSAKILRKDRARHRKRQNNLQFLIDEGPVLRTEINVLQDKQKDHGSELEQLKEELNKIPNEKLANKQTIKQLTKEHQELSLKLRDAQAHLDTFLTDIKASSQRLTSASEESRQKAAKATQLRAELQRESARSRQLRGVLHESDLILHHILTGSEEEALSAGERLLEILESAAPQGPARKREERR